MLLFLIRFWLVSGQRRQRASPAKRLHQTARISTAARTSDLCTQRLGAGRVGARPSYRVTGSLGHRGDEHCLPPADTKLVLIEQAAFTAVHLARMALRRKRPAPTRLPPGSHPATRSAMRARSKNWGRCKKPTYSCEPEGASDRMLSLTRSAKARALALAGLGADRQRLQPHHPGRGGADRLRRRQSGSGQLHPQLGVGTRRDGRDDQRRRARSGRDRTVPR